MLAITRGSFVIALVVAGVVCVAGEDEPWHIEAIPANELLAREPALLAQAKESTSSLPFDKLDVLVIDRIGKTISGDGADPNVTGRYPTPYGSGGPQVTRIVFLDVTDESLGNANGLARSTSARFGFRNRPCGKVE